MNGTATLKLGAKRKRDGRSEASMSTVLLRIGSTCL
jgi:hypothetical protein